MRPKIIYMTNIDRRYFMMRRALSELIAEGEMPASCAVLKTEDGSVWSASWEEKLRGSALVMIRFMGNTIRTKFWTACMHFLSREGIPYYMDAAGSAEEELCRACRGEGYRGIEGVLILWGADELQESLALCAGAF